MYDKDSKGISYSAGFFMLIAFTVAGVVLATFVSIPVWEAMTGISAFKMDEALSDPANADAVKMIQAITALVGFLLPAIVTAAMLSHKPMKLVGLSYKISWKQAGLVCAIMFTALFVTAFLSYLNDHLPLSEELRQRFDKMESEYNKQVQAVLSLNNITDYLVALLVMAVLPALCEEALFRGGLQNYLTRWSNKPWLSIIVVSILFSAAHFSFYGFFPRLFLGLLLGIIFQYSGRLWLCILAHFFNNALAVTAIYIAKEQGKSMTDAMAENNDTWVGVFALPVVIVLLIIFKKVANKPKEVPDGITRNEELRNTPFY